MKKSIQCKDIPDRPIPEFLATPGFADGFLGAVWWDQHDSDPRYPPTVRKAMPPDIDDKLALAKMGQLVRRGLVRGCLCGCRGDFRIGQQWLEAPHGA